MKKIYYLILIAGLGLGLSSCENEEAHLSVNTNDISLDANDNISRTVYVLSQNVGWSIEVEKAAQSWLGVVKEGEKIVISAGDYDGATPRAGKITIIPDRNSVDPQFVVVTQKTPSGYSMTVSDDELNFAPTGYSPQTITITTENIEWRAEVTEGMEWISITELPDGNSLSVTMLSDKTTWGAREGKIRISPDRIDEMLPTIVTVKQGGIGLSALPVSLEFEALPSATKTINVTAENVGFTAELKNPVADAWISTLTVNGNAITVGVDQSEGSLRTGTIVIKPNNALISAIEVPVTQNGVTLAATPGFVNLSGTSATTQNVTVSYTPAAMTVNWTATLGDPVEDAWITLTQNGDVLEVSAVDNDAARRTGTIVITADDYDVPSVEIIVNQAKNPAYVEIEDYVGTYTVSATKMTFNTGTASWEPAPAAWQGQMVIDEETGSLVFNNWGGVNGNLWVFTYEDEQITVNTEGYFSVSGLSGYLLTADCMTLTPGVNSVSFKPGQTMKLDLATKKVVFPPTIDVSGTPTPIAYGVSAWVTSTGAFGGTFGGVFYDVVIEKTGGSPSPVVPQSVPLMLNGPSKTMSNSPVAAKILK